MIYKQIQLEYNRLQKEILTLESKLKEFPVGKLICARNKTRCKWYHSKGTSTTYLPKRERALAEQLAAKKYLSLQLQDLQHEKRAIEFYLRHHNPNQGLAAQLLMDTPAYRELLASYFQPHPQDDCDWNSSPFAQNPRHPEQLIHKTISGRLVRSKSEVLIDMALFTHHIPFRYECALVLNDITLYPDFTIRHPITGKIYYWEHFGMMDDESYCRNAFSKLQLYTSCGIVPTIQLITTYETKDHPLNPQVLDEIVTQYFC